MEIEGETAFPFGSTARAGWTVEVSQFEAPQWVTTFPQLGERRVERGGAIEMK